jgi:predicted permease
MIVGVTVSVFAVIGTGALARRIGWLSEEADRSLLKLGVGLFLPCLIFSVVSDNPALRQTGNLVLPPLVGFGTMVLGLAVAGAVTRLGTRLTGLEGAAQARTFALAVGFYNYGFIPLPLVRRIFDDNTLGVLFVHNVGAGLALWTVGVAVLSGARQRRAWRRMLNPPSIAVITGVAFNLLGLTPLARDHAGFLLTAVEWMGQAAVPILLILVGATMAEQFRSGGRGEGRQGAAKVITWSCLLRLGLLPAAFLLIAAWIPASRELKSVIIVQAAMPGAVIPVLLARHYHGHPATALRVALSTALLSLITIPLWISLGMTLLLSSSSSPLPSSVSCFPFLPFPLFPSYTSALLG